jgi:hypothetical protein
MNEDCRLHASTEVGLLGVCHLKRLWSSAIATGRGEHFNRDDEWHLDRLVIDGLGLGLEPTLQYLHLSTPTFEAFERWVLMTAGEPETRQISRINAIVNGTEYPEETRRWLASIEADDPVLSAKELAFWDAQGYVIVHDAVEAADLHEAQEAVWQYLGARPDAPESWYQNRDHSIMVPFFQHPAFTANRQSARIHKAFAQLWQTADLWVTTDRCGFNAPERDAWPFPGPDLHWDVNLQDPIPFGTQGLLYLTDTPVEQGALTLVPGFHQRIQVWLEGLPPDTDPHQQDLHALGSQAVAGRAGDMVIWHHALPHGSRPNRGRNPRIVQYINRYPARDAAYEVLRQPVSKTKPCD